MADPVNIRVMVPRVRRALEGAGTTPALEDDAVKDVVADACSDVLLYTGSLFGHDLLVLERDTDTGAPSEYATSEELTLAEQSVIAAQAALNYFFFLFAGLKVTERIADEGSSWEYQLSANLLVEQLKYLQKTRDKALEAVAAQTPALDAYVSFLAIRDVETSRAIEPWAHAHGVGGLEWAGR